MITPIKLIDLANNNDRIGILPVANGGTGVATASANTFFAGPSSGAAAAPSFRAIVSADLSSGIVAPTGAIIPYAGTSVPSGWVECTGTAASRTDFADLFAAIGTTWGAGNGTTTFNVPDLRGRAIIGDGTGTGLTARTVAQTGGTETHQLTSSEMPAHTHTGGVSSTFAVAGGGSATVFQAPTANTGSTGGDGSHNNMQPFAVVKWLIKA